MIEFLKRLFQREGSSATAKDRLRLVLMTDHLELAPEMIETMKRDFVDVISRYVQVDRDKIDVTFDRQDRTLAMLANIPILSVNRPNGNGAAKRERPTLPPPAVSSGKPPVRKRRRRKKALKAATSPAQA
jgi:cell division topological specificity factor